MVERLDFKCHTCGEDFESDLGCLKHHLETKHEDFELVGLNKSITIKSHEDF